MWITGVRKLKGREQRCGHVSIWILFPSWWRPVETLLHPLSSHRGRGHCPWNGALATGPRRQVIKWLHSHLICMELLRITSESSQEAPVCCLVVPKGTWPLIILLPDQVHKSTCLYLQSGRKKNYNFCCLYKHLNRHTGPQHFLVYCFVRMANIFSLLLIVGN
jgi:hypothetical protein